MSNCTCESCTARYLRLVPTVRETADAERLAYIERTFGATREPIDRLILAEADMAAAREMLARGAEA